MWREICAKGTLVLDHIRCLVGDGSSIDICRDAWISTTPLSRWPSFVSSELAEDLRVSDLITEDGRSWRTQEIFRLFGSQLAIRILSTPIPIFRSQDIRVWGSSCHPRAPTGSLYELCGDRPEPSFVAGWIWRTPVHPRVQLFLWKVVWNRLPTRSLLRRRGMDLDGDCPICGDPDESTEHALLSCPRARLVWRMAGYRQWEEADGPRLHAFTQFVQQSRTQEIGMAICTAYQIWLSRNAVTFESVTTPVHRILSSARRMATEFHAADIDTLSGDPGIWDSHAAPAAALRAILVRWEPPPPGYVKVNFDGSVRGASGGAGFVIRDDEGRLLAAAGFFLHNPSVPEAELRAAWTGIIRATQQMRMDRVIIEGDSAVVVGWMHDRDVRHDAPPILRDIRHILHGSPRTVVRHVYREANSAADWVASHVAHHSGNWSWSQGDCIPPHLLGLLFLDIQGHLRIRGG